jgi:site-specific DNA-methyltransferase (adenine-specific)
MADKEFGGEYTTTAPATEDAKKWEGWGTALKPAYEPWILARKPIREKTIARNILKHGTGGLNIDACRISLNGDYKCKANGRPSLTGLGDNYDPESANCADTVGRFPANFIHDGSSEVMVLFPETSSGSLEPHHAPLRKKQGDIFGKYKGLVVPSKPFIGSSGSAARFFYCAKANKEDRTEGGLANNKHVTVKPSSLMRYLCRLITPAGGTVLDPFSGSGSTVKAAVLEGFNAIGIDINLESFNIAKERITSAIVHSEKKSKEEWIKRRKMIDREE